MTTEAVEHSYTSLVERYSDLERRHTELVRQMGDEISPFPPAGIDGFLSHFILTVEFLRGDAAGEVVSLTMPPATQTVARSDPFVYRGPGAGHVAEVPIPASSTLSGAIGEDLFLNRPDEYFTPGHETVWMQILNLDARMEDSPLGPVRIILGETLKSDYPEVFEPSLGVAQALGDSGFPARLFFNPCAVIETELGAFRAVHGTLAYGRITSFPPCATPVSICDFVPLESVANLRDQKVDANPVARIIALTHPIDVSLQIPGEAAFDLVEKQISKGIQPSTQG
jgi:hypothetical protein